MGVVHQLASVAAMLASAISPHGMASHQRIDCPDNLAAETVQVIAAPSGWIPFTPTVLRLHSATFMAGPPASMTILKEDASTSAKNQQVDTWYFRSPQPDGIWLTCGYGLGNEVTLSKRMEDAIIACSVTYSNREQDSASAIVVMCTSSRPPGR